MSTQKEETRLRLLEAAEKLLLERGFHRVGLEDIAEAAGVSRQAVYKSHFSSKADLLLALVQHTHVAKKLDELIEPIHAVKDGPEMLHETIRTIVRIEARVHDIACVLSSAAASDEGAKAAWNDRLQVKRGAYRAALERTKADGRLNPEWKVEECVDLVAALTSVDTYHQLVLDQGWKPDHLIARVWQICQKNLLIEPKGRASKR